MPADALPESASTNWPAILRFLHRHPERTPRKPYEFGEARVLELAAKYDLTVAPTEALKTIGTELGVLLPDGQVRRPSASLSPDGALEWAGRIAALRLLQEAR